MYKTPIPVIAPTVCPGCKEPKSKHGYGPVHDVVLWDDKFNFGEGGYVRIVGFICGNVVFGTVIDSFDADRQSRWERFPRPYSTEHTYILDLRGRKIDEIRVSDFEVEVMTREEYAAQSDAAIAEHSARIARILEGE